VKVLLVSLRDELITLTNIHFSSPNLVVLKLKELYVPTEILSVNLPSLETLHLKMVYFESFMDSKKFLFQFPVLEELHTKYIHLRKVREEGFEASFYNLVRTTICPFDIPFKAIYNVEFLRILKVRMWHHACFLLVVVAQ